MPTPDEGQQSPGYATLEIASVTVQTGFDPTADLIGSFRVLDAGDPAFDPGSRAIDSSVGNPPYSDDLEAFAIGIHSVDPGSAGVGSGEVGDVSSLIGLKILATGSYTNVVVPVYPIADTSDVRILSDADSGEGDPNDGEIAAGTFQSFPPAGEADGPSVQAAVYDEAFSTGGLPEPVATSSVVTVTNDLKQNTNRNELIPVRRDGGAVLIEREDPADGPLEGRVVDTDTGEPLSWAIVEDTSTEEPTLIETDDEGFFSIPVPEQEVSLRVVASTYEDTVLSVGPETRDIQPIGLQQLPVSSAEIENTYQTLAEDEAALPDNRPDGRLFPPDQFNTATVSDDELGVEAEITAEGGVPEAVAFERDDRRYFDVSAINSAAASDVVAFRSKKRIESATLTVGYDPADVPGKENDLSLHRFDPQFQTFVSIDSTVDTTTQTVTADIGTNGVFVVLDPGQWAVELDSNTPRPLSADGSVQTSQPTDDRFTTQ